MNVSFALDAARSNNRLMIDSGAGASVISDSSMFLTLEAPITSSTVNFGKQKVVPVAAVGTIAFDIPPQSRNAGIRRASRTRILLHNVLYVPDAGPGLAIISVHTLRQHGHGVNFDTEAPYVRWHSVPKDIYQPCVWSGQIPYVSIEACTNSNTHASCFHVSDPPADLAASHAHARFGHVGNSKLDALAKLCVIPKSVADAYKHSPCSDCQLANGTRDPYPQVDGIATQPGDVLHADLLHFPEPTIDGKRYALITIDEHSRYIEVALLSKKSDAAAHLVRIMKRTQTLTNRPVKYLRTDLGGEFQSTVLKVEKEMLGVSDQHIPARCHESNGLVERVNRTLASMARSVLKSSHLPLAFWGEALLYVVHTYNLLPHRALLARGCDVPIPHASFLNETPERLSRLHDQLLPFGMSCFIHTVDDHPKKLADRAFPGFVLGYGPSSHLYRVLIVDPTTGNLKFRIVRHLTVTKSNHAEYHAREQPPFVLKKPVRMCHVATSVEPLFSGVTRVACELGHPSIPSEAVLASHMYPHPVPPAGVSISALSSAVSHAVEHADPLGRDHMRERRIQRFAPNRDRCEPALLSFEICSESSINNASSNACNAGVVRVQSRPSDTMSSACMQKQMNDQQVLYIITVDDMGETIVLQVESDSPTVKVALSGRDADEWIESLSDEIKSIQENQVYELVDPPPGVNIVGSKWILKYKRNAFGEIERRKSRLVAQGFSQKPGVDYTDLYSPTPQQATLRMVLLYAARFELHVRQVDIKCAFLQGDLQETIYMRQPPLFGDGTNKVWKLKKPLYGLKQAPRQWNKKLSSVLHEMGFKQADNDAALFVNPAVKALIFVWVDDLIIVADSAHTESLVNSILNRFEGRDLGEASWILGLEVTRDHVRKTITMSQRRMIYDILARFGLSEATKVSTPLDPGQPVDVHPHRKAVAKLQKQIESSDLSLDERESLEERISNYLKDGEPLDAEGTTKYMQIVGAVQYLATVSRPDISFATGSLARFMSKPTKYLLKCAERLLRYLKGTAEYGLVLDGSKVSSGPTLTAYSDSDYQRNSYSTTGIVLCMFGQPVHWRSKRQTVIPQSSCEAEIMAMNKGALTLKWFKMLALGDIGITSDVPVLFGDNQSAITICRDPQSSDRTRHIDDVHKKVQELVKNEVLCVKWIPTAEMLADCLTKQLPKPAFEQFRTDIGVRPLAP